RRVGRATVAVGLMAFGVALLIDNLYSNYHALNLLVKLWPLALIGFGLEYLVHTVLLQRSESDHRLRFDWGGTILLTLVIILSLGIATFRGFITSQGGGIIPFLHMGPAESRTETVSASAEGVKQIVAEVNVGTVTVQENSNKSEIRVEATYTAQGFSLDTTAVREQLNNIRLDLTKGEVVRLMPELSGQLANIGIQYVIYAPPGLTVQATTGTGWIDVPAYHGNLQLTSRVGRIGVQSGSGSLTASSTSGFISVRNFEGPISAHTTVGALDLGEVNGELQLDTTTGSINVNGFSGGKLMAETRTGGIHASTRTILQGDVTLKTQTGAVGLTVPKESGMKVTAQTNSGSLSVPSFMSVNRTGPASSAVGTNGDGKYTVSLAATTGSVNLNAN
ncbi:MAG: DUF4097 family beta strand repeat-containing protein, partial [Mycobacterium leprae]